MEFTLKVGWEELRKKRKGTGQWEYRNVRKDGLKMRELWRRTRKLAGFKDGFLLGECESAVQMCINLPVLASWCWEKGSGPDDLNVVYPSAERGKRISRSGF